MCMSQRIDFKLMSYRGTVERGEILRLDIETRYNLSSSPSAWVLVRLGTVIEV